MLILFAGGSRVVLEGAFKLNAIVTAGLQLEKQFCLSNKIDSGTISFLLASVLNSVAPALCKLDPRVDGMAWSHFLQSALVLGLWSTNTSQAKPAKNVNTRQWIALFIVFLIGTFGSTIGGYVGFHAAGLSLNVGGKSFPLNSLSILSACLTASYIGGTVNFFETAKILGANTSETKKALLNLVAGVDIGVMVLYFSLLSAIRNSPIQRIFPTATSETGSTDALITLPLIVSSVQNIICLENKIMSHNGNSPNKYFVRKTLNYLPSVILSGCVSMLANFVQKKVPVPGVSVTVATIVGILFLEAVENFQYRATSNIELSSAGVTSVDIVDVSPDKITMRAKEAVRIKSELLLKNLKEHSAGSSKFMMGLFYSTIGLGFRFNEIQTIWGPIGTLIGITLSCHLSVLIGGSLLWNSSMRSAQRHFFDSKKFGKDANNASVKGNQIDDYLIHLDTALVARSDFSSIENTRTILFQNSSPFLFFPYLSYELTVMPVWVVLQLLPKWRRLCRRSLGGSI
jgi:Protein of unknown function (DUF819)